MVRRPETTKHQVRRKLGFRQIGALELYGTTKFIHDLTEFWRGKSFSLGYESTLVFIMTQQSSPHFI
jgi:hypothetical protein